MALVDFLERKDWRYMEAEFVKRCTWMEKMTMIVQMCWHLLECHRAKHLWARPRMPVVKKNQKEKKPQQILLDVPRKRWCMLQGGGKTADRSGCPGMD